MKIDITKFSPNDKATIESGAVMLRQGGVLEYKFSTEAGLYLINLKVRTGQGQVLKNNDLIDGYKVSIDGKAAVLKTGAIGAMEARFGKSYWGFLSTELQLSKGEHTIRIEAVKDWLGIDSIEITPIKIDEIPSPVDYKVKFEEEQKKVVAEKIRADTAEVNLNKIKAELTEAKANEAKWLNMLKRQKARLYGDKEKTLSNLKDIFEDFDQVP